MRGVHLFMIIVALPAIAALGHDIYLFYINMGVDSVDSVVNDVTNMAEQKGVLSFFAALGYIWTQYHPESYKWVIENIDQDSWNVINGLLAQKALFIGLAFAFLNYFILLILKVFGTWPFAESGGVMSGKNRKAPTLKKQSGKMKYKRK